MSANKVLARQKSAKGSPLGSFSFFRRRSIVRTRIKAYSSTVVCAMRPATALTKDFCLELAPVGRI
ncbi:hypothetical protein K2X83_02290, partial [Patescibacteria group bacterium]|nr:hypothetical protein [Patescibacteria group bacterium]